MFPKRFPSLLDPKMKYLKFLILTHDDKLWKKIIWRLYLPYKFIYLIGALMFSYQYFGHFDLLVGVLVTFPVAFQSFLKSTLLIVRNEKIKNVLNIVDTKFWDASIISGNVLETIQFRYLFVDTMVKGHTTVGFFAFIFACVFPAAKYPEGVKQLPGIFWGPFDTNITPTYEILCIILTWNNFMGYFTNLIYESLFVYVSEHTVCQFEILHYCLENLIHWPDKNTINSTIANLEYKRRLKLIIQHHNLLFNCIEEIQDLISWSMVTQIPMATVCLFTSGYFLSMYALDDLLTAFNLLFYGITVTVELSIYCFYGSEIVYESFKTRDAAYSCDWSSAGLSVQKSIQILIMNVKDGIQLKAGGMSPLNNNTVLSVYKTVFSCITLLKQMNEKVTTSTD